MKYIKKSVVIATLSLLLSPLCIMAYTEDAVMVRSRCMDKDVPVNVILPQEYSDTMQYPVVYLLHGYSDKYTSWSREEQMEWFLEKYNAIVG